VRQLGLDKRQLGGPRRVDVAALQRLWVDGMRVADIAVRFKVSVGTVHEWAKRFKLPQRPRALPDPRHAAGRAAKTADPVDRAPLLGRTCLRVRTASRRPTGHESRSSKKNGLEDSAHAALPGKSGL